MAPKGRLRIHRHDLKRRGLVRTPEHPGLWSLVGRISTSRPVLAARRLYPDLTLANFLQSLGAWAPALVFLLATAEAAAFLGLFVPGEMAVILGGVAAATGAAPLWTMILAAVLGAIFGDSVGYRLGHRLGPAVLNRPRFRRIGAHLESATAILGRSGWWALVVARFTSVLRAVVPFAAGMGAMPYGRFLLGNVIGGVLWGTTFTMVGYAAGASYDRVAAWFRTGGLVVAALVATIGSLIWMTRWIAAHPEQVKRRFQPLLSFRSVRWVVGAAAGPVRRLRGSIALAVTAVAVVGGSWIFGALLQDLLASEEFILFDASSLRYLASHPVSFVISGARFVANVTSPSLALIAALVAALVWLALRRPRAALATVLAPVGAWGVARIASNLVARVPPQVEPLIERVDFGFPSSKIAIVAALLLAMAWPWGEVRWAVITLRFGSAVILATIAASSLVVLLAEYPSDVLAGMAVAVVWTILVCAILDSRVRVSVPIATEQTLSL